jgi:LPS export ABC transporter protein LptC/lipopolysaccharide transport protein LptA
MIWYKRGLFLFLLGWSTVVYSEHAFFMDTVRSQQFNKEGSLYLQITCTHWKYKSDTHTTELNEPQLTSYAHPSLIGYASARKGWIHHDTELNVKHMGLEEGVLLSQEKDHQPLWTMQTERLLCYPHTHICESSQATSTDYYRLPDSLRVHAHSAQFFLDKNQGLYTGKVHLVHPSYTISAHQLSVEEKCISATGLAAIPVRALWKLPPDQTHLKGQASFLSYETHKQILLLKENASLQIYDHHIKGPCLLYDLRSHKVRNCEHSSSHKTTLLYQEES